MQPEERNQFAERWLDQALAHYSDAEPRPGLESRILANLAEANAAHNHFWQSPVVIASACAAIISLAVGLGVLRYLYAPVQPVLVASPLTPRVPVPSPVRATIPQRATLRPTQRLVKRSAEATIVAAKESRKPQFPSAMPLSGQQSLVLAYIIATPTEELIKIAAEQRAWQDHVESGAKATQVQESPPGPDINYLRFPPLDSGNTQAGSLESR